VLPLGNHEVGAAQSVTAVQVVAIDRQAVIGLRGGPQPRPTGRVKLLDDRLEVPRGLARSDVSAHGGHGHDVQVRIRQGQTQRHGIVDARSTSRITFLAIASSYLEVARDFTTLGQFYALEGRIARAKLMWIPRHTVGRSIQLTRRFTASLAF